MLDLLMTLSDEDAQAVLRRIRAGTDVVDIVNHVKTGNLLLQMAVLPETRFRYEFPYKSGMPEDYIANNPYLESLIYEASSLYSASGSLGQSRSTSASRIANLSSEEYQNLYLKPFHAAEIVDSRLYNVKISSWTSVCDNDVLMRNLLSGWLRCEYHFTAALQKDIFLEDMAAQREDFCSSLLVNIMLAYSCVRYLEPYSPASNLVLGLLPAVLKSR